MDNNDIVERLARLETKLDMHLTRASDHEARIRRLEQALWWASGVAMAGGGMVGAVLGRVG
ncbi:MAG TPA: hypothetical protein VF174_09835 [Micromonosporaceae bacterium]